MRDNIWSKTYPTDWCPNSVQKPGEDIDKYFTDVTAWEFIASLLENGHPVEIITLDVPLGKKGFVIHKEMPDGQMLYIKLQLVGDKIKGRSFHYSYLDQK